MVSVLVCWQFFPFSKGEMLSVFFILCFLCLVRCLLSFFSVLLFLGSLFGKIFGSELLFLGVGVGLVCFGAVLPMFLLYFCFFAPETVLKNSLDVRSGVFGLSSFFLWFFADVVVFLSFFFFFFERDSSGSNRAHPHTHLVLLFLFLVFVSRRVCLSPVLAVRPFASGVLSGCHSGPRAFLVSPGLL